MRLGMLTVDWPPIEGGIATLCAGLAGALQRRGHEVTVHAPARRGHTGQECSPGLSVERWPGYDLGPARLLPFAARTWGALRGFDACLAMNPAYGGLLALARRELVGPPYLAWAYGYELLKTGGGPLRRLYREVFARARAAIAISRYTRELLRELSVPEERIALIHPGVDPPAEPGGSIATLRLRHGLGQRPYLLTVGRLVPRKGHDCLLEAFQRRVNAGSELDWVVVGRGALGEALAERVRSRGLAGRVHLLGYLPALDLESLYRSALAFVLVPEAGPGDAEGFGIVFLEAGARGVPVVAGDSGGVRDAVLDGTTGLLTPPGDATALAAALLRLEHDPALRRRLGEGGRRLAAALSWDRAAGAVEDCLR